MQLERVLATFRTICGCSRVDEMNKWPPPTAFEVALPGGGRRTFSLVNFDLHPYLKKVGIASYEETVANTAETSENRV